MPSLEVYIALPTMTWSMRSGVMPARSIAARAAMAPSSIADTLASAPPGWPSPRLPPIHSAMGVRAPETMAMSASEDLATDWLLRLRQGWNGWAGGDPLG